MPRDTLVTTDWVVAGLCMLALVQTLRLAWMRTREARRIRQHRTQGARGEKEARRALRAAGYAILAEHPRGSWVVRVDGTPIEIELCPDFLVERRGRRFIADAKTGKSATIEHAATRRQLLEYHRAFDVDGVLLVGPAGVQRVEL